VALKVLAVAADSVDLVNEHDAGRLLLGCGPRWGGGEGAGGGWGGEAGRQLAHDSEGRAVQQQRLQQRQSKPAAARQAAGHTHQLRRARACACCPRPRTAPQTPSRRGRRTARPPRLHAGAGRGGAGGWPAAQPLAGRRGPRPRQLHPLTTPAARAQPLAGPSSSGRHWQQVSGASAQQARPAPSPLAPHLPPPWPAASCQCQADP
jgi:hypothetical protein